MVVLAVLTRAKDGEGVKSGPIGLAVILLLCVAMYFLMKSMSKHLKRVREEFPADAATALPAAGEIPPREPDDPAQPAAEPTADSP